MLYLVSTPIGNLGDITLRAIETLKSVDLVLAEDTRTAMKLFQKYDLHTPLKSFHSYSTDRDQEKILVELKAGKSIALISDAGTPLVSDPGWALVHAALEQGIQVVPIPGATAFVPALQLSGFPMNEFRYRGFIPLKKGRETFIKEVSEDSSVTVFYESSHRIEKLLDQMEKILDPSRQIAVVREITKIYEEVLKGTVTEVKLKLAPEKVRGEFVVVVGPI